MYILHKSLDKIPLLSSMKKVNAPYLFRSLTRKFVYLVFYLWIYWTISKLCDGNDWVLFAAVCILD